MSRSGFSIHHVPFRDPAKAEALVRAELARTGIRVTDEGELWVHDVRQLADWYFQATASQEPVVLNMTTASPSNALHWHWDDARETGICTYNGWSTEIMDNDNFSEGDVLLNRGDPKNPDDLHVILPNSFGMIKGTRSAYLSRSSEPSVTRAKPHKSPQCPADMMRLLAIMYRR